MPSQKKSVHTPSGSKSVRKITPKSSITLFEHDGPLTKNRRPKKKPAKTDETDFESQLDNLIQALQENYMQQKRLMCELKDLKTLHKREIKRARNDSTSSKNSGKHSGFNKPQPVPEKLRRLLEIDDTDLPRSTVTSLMYQYFRSNDMCDKKDITPSKEIKKIFDMQDDDVMNFFNFQTWLKKLYKVPIEEKLII